MRDLAHERLPQFVLTFDLVHEDPIVSVHADEGVDQVVGLVGDLELHLEVDDFVLIVEKL